MTEADQDSPQRDKIDRSQLVCLTEHRLRLTLSVRWTGQEGCKKVSRSGQRGQRSRHRGAARRQQSM